MRFPCGRPIRDLAIAVAAVALASTAAALLGGQSSAAPDWRSLLPAALAIGLALVTHRVILSLAASVLLGGLLSMAGGPKTAWEGVLRTTGAGFLWQRHRCEQPVDPAVRRADHGHDLRDARRRRAAGVAQWLMRFARSVRSTQVVTVIAGLVIFIDDYANTMIVGSTLRPADRSAADQPREAGLPGRRHGRPGRRHRRDQHLDRRTRSACWARSARSWASTRTATRSSSTPWASASTASG